MQQDRKQRRTKRRLWRILPLTALLILLLVALFMVSGFQQDAIDASSLNDVYLWVLVITILALLLILWGIASRLLRLIKSVRTKAPGALLSARWVRNFLIMSLPPVMIVYFFSAWFLTSTIDSWFDVKVDRALSDSLDLARVTLEEWEIDSAINLAAIASDLQELREEGDLLRQAILSRVRATGPAELSVLETDGSLIATASINSLTGLPERVNDYALLQTIQTGNYSEAEPSANGEMQIRALVSMPAQYPGDSERILQAIYPLPVNITALTGSIRQEYDRYQNVTYLRESLKQSYLLILSLVFLLTVLLAILAALSAARRMVSPLSRLSTATQEVAAGDFGRDVEAGERDEIGFLVSSFNDMTRALKAASLSAEQSRAELEAQGDYLETVLGNLSSGVLTLDSDETIIRANRACREILSLPDQDSLTPTVTSLQSLAKESPGLEPFVAAIRHQYRRGKTNWQQEISINRSDSRLVLLLRGSKMQNTEPDSTAPDQGQVVVFDDVTILNQAQREAAWSEVARRLAHEVKNPLTPIRLAAERLHMKLSGKLDEADDQLLGRAANTIIAQVEALRTLVDAFGDYASEPVLSRTPIKLDSLIREVISLYEQGETDLTLKIDLIPGPDGLAADGGRIRQLLHNLVRNAKESTGGEGVVIKITSKLKEMENQSWVHIEICDSGPGFPDPVLENPFEPYVSHKPGGSGLGLAICRKIVAEHDGRITLSNRKGGGARVSIFLPLQKNRSPASLLPPSAEGGFTRPQ